MPRTSPSRTTLLAARAPWGEHPHRHQLPRSADLAGGAGSIRRIWRRGSAKGRPCVAESGVAGADDACDMRRLGYDAALVGTALMGCDDPAALLEENLGARLGQCSS